jgi:hypothetical protein
MTAKEKVREHLPSWTEKQAQRALVAAEPPNNGNGRGDVRPSAPVGAERYPILLRALRNGEITGSHKPLPDSRTLRTIDLDDDALDEAHQVAFGELGRPPARHAPRPR